MKTRFRAIRFRALAALVVAALAPACAGSGDDAVRTVTAGVAREAPDAGGGFDRIPEVVDAVAPSVVAVLVEGERGTGEGSGVIWTSDGVVVTNDHVVRGASAVEVAFADGERASAEIVATDPRTDLAVLRASRDALPAAAFADDLPDVGELAIAIGNPLGFEQTVTAGIVSGLARSIPSGGRTPALIDLVQTDAPISPGNSGGALVDATGEVIGINVAYIPPPQGAVAIGFAIPSPTVTDVVEQLLDDGQVEHSYLGVRPAPVTPTIAERFDLPTEGGAVVADVAADSPAEAAGIRVGDVIVEAGGRRVGVIEDLLAEIRRRDPGDALELTLVRGGERIEIAAELAELPEGS